MVRLIFSPPEPGQYDVVNQISAVYRVVDLAETVAEVGKEFNLKVKIQRLENPRVESDKHPMEAISTKLEGEFDLKPKVKLKEELRRMFKLLTQSKIKKRLEEKRHVVAPKTRWNGVKEEMDVLDQYDPGTRKFKSDLKQQLDRIDGIGHELSGIEDED
jgi:UDP-sulfoquinovose synthase